MHTLYLSVLFCILFDITKQDSVDRLSYGTVFIADNKIMINAQFWRHTFILELPRVNLKTLPMILCKQANRSASCGTRNALVRKINGVTKELFSATDRAIQQSKRLIGSEINYRPDKNQKKGSRTKRGLLNFVGEIGDSLFGIATAGDLKKLAKHLKVVLENQNELNAKGAAVAQTLDSYINKTNDRLNGLSSMIKKEHQALNNIHKALTNVGLYARALEVETEIYLPALINRTALSNRIQQQTDMFLMGLHTLVRRRLPPEIISRDALLQALRVAARALRRKHPKFKVIYNHPSYYYDVDDVMFAMSGRRIYVTLFIPISAREAIFNLYRLVKFDVPLNESTRHATRVMNLPHYLAISVDNKYFVEMSTDDLLQCSGSPMKRCSAFMAHRSVVDGSCAMAIYKGFQPEKKCKILVVENAIAPLLYEIEPGKIVVTGIKNIVFTCPNGVIRKTGCNLCSLTVPCLCALDAGKFSLAPRLDSCISEGTISKNYPVNLALLKQFFNNSELAHLDVEAKAAFPTKYNIPPLRLKDDEFNNWVNDDKGLQRDLTEVAELMRNNKDVYRTETPRIWNNALDDDNKYPHILSYVSAATIIILMIAYFLIYRKVAMLVAAFALISGSNHAQAQSFVSPSVIKEPINKTLNFIQTSQSVRVPIDNHPALTPDHLLLYLELSSLILLSLYGCLKLKYCLKKYTNHTQVLLEIRYRNRSIDIPLTNLHLFPSDYNLVLVDWLSGLKISKTGCLSAVIIITWSNFFLSERNTGNIINLPQSINVNVFQRITVEGILNNSLDSGEEFVALLKLLRNNQVTYIKQQESIYANPLDTLV